MTSMFQLKIKECSTNKECEVKYCRYSTSDITKPSIYPVSCTYYCGTEGQCVDYTLPDTTTTTRVVVSTTGINTTSTTLPYIYPVTTTNTTSNAIAYPTTTTTGMST